MNVYILASYDLISYYFFYPLFVLRPLLASFNIHIKFFTKIEPDIYRGDVLLIDNRFFTPFWKNDRAKALDTLELIRKRCFKVIWLDVTDSTGATQFQVLPFVDRYFKKQLLKDRSLYTKNFYGARIYTDYYKNHFNLPAEEVFSVEPVNGEDIPKLDVSWNLGMGPCHLRLGVSNLLRKIPFSLKRLIPLNFAPYFYQTGRRKKDVCFRGSDQYNNKAIAFQRLEIKKQLEARNVSTKPISRWAYLRELKTTNIGISPFGAGEVCFRDFEIIMNGGLLFKADMSHLETWPDLFVNDRTYGAFKWDFSDFDQQLDRFLGNPKLREQIANTAQVRYHEAFSPKGQDDFCRRFLQLLR